VSDAPAGSAGSAASSQLGDELKSLLEQRRALVEKLSRLEESRGAVSPAVYAKVRDDYATRLDAVESRLEPLMASARENLDGLKQRHAEAQGEYQRLSEELEELRLRNSLGEFEGQAYAEQEAGKLGAIERAKKRRDELAAELESYQQDAEPARASGPSTSPIASPYASPVSRNSATVPAHPSPGSELEATASDPGLPPSAYVRRRSETVPEPSGVDLGAGDIADTRGEPEPQRPAAGQAGSHPAPVLIIKNKDNREESYDLQAGPTLVGRAPENDIILLEDESISRRHCRFVVDGKSVTIEDLNSSNGSYVNAERLPARAPRQLEDNDVIKMGKTLALFRIGSDSED